MRNFTMTETSDSWTELWKPAADTKLQTPRSTSLYGKEDDSLQKNEVKDESMLEKGLLEIMVQFLTTSSSLSGITSNFQEKEN